MTRHTSPTNCVSCKWWYIKDYIIHWWKITNACWIRIVTQCIVEIYLRCVYYSKSTINSYRITISSKCWNSIIIDICWISRCSKDSNKLSVYLCNRWIYRRVSSISIIINYSYCDCCSISTIGLKRKCAGSKWSIHLRYIGIN